MALGEVARDCRVGEGNTSSGRNSGSSAKRSSKSTSDRTLLESSQSHLPCPACSHPLSYQPHRLHHSPQPMLTCPQSQRSSSGAGAAPSPSCRYQSPPCAQGCLRLPCHYCPHCCRCCCYQGLGLGPGPGPGPGLELGPGPGPELGWEGWEAPLDSPGPAQGRANLKTSWGICWPGVRMARRWRTMGSESLRQNPETQRDGGSLPDSLGKGLVTQLSRRDKGTAQTCMQGRGQDRKADSGLRDRAQQQWEPLGLLGTHHGLRALSAGPLLSRWE